MSCGRTAILARFFAIKSHYVSVNKILLTSNRKETGDDDENKIELDDRKNFRKKRGHSGEMSNLQFSDAQAINQLSVSSN